MPDNQSQAIQSFVRRGGRMSPKRTLAMEQLWPQFGLNPLPTPYDFPHIFGRDGYRVLEIGFGMGHLLQEQAKLHPDWDFVGIDVHTSGIGAVLLGMYLQNLNNIRLYEGDAIPVLQECILPHSFDEIWLFFPDPWPKKRHHKRRIVQPSFLDLIHRALKPNGHFHAATDAAAYAEHMLHTLCAHPKFQNTSPTQDYCQRPAHRPQTKYELRGIQKGHAIFDLIFKAL